MHSDTIYAVSTGAGKSAVAVLRVSGSRVDFILRQLCGPRRFVSRQASLTPIFGIDGKLLDRGIVIRFDAPKSFTGEAMVEFQVTGGRAVVRGLLEILALCPGTRHAEAGEFAKRAFDNGKLDLVEVEGLAGVVEAETRMQLRQAQTLASGDLSKECESARGVLLNAMAVMESILDFSDVEDADALLTDAIIPSVVATISRLELLLDKVRVSERLREGMSVVIAGPPNVGKSTLLNCLAQRDIAIVSPVAGTTRDIIEVLLDVEGFPIVLSDSAGIRDAVDPVETMGIARTLKKASAADLILWLSDGKAAESSLTEGFTSPVLKVRSKSDLSPARNEDEGYIFISAKTGEGIADLVSRVGDFAREHFVGVGSLVAATDRQRQAIKNVIDALCEILANPGKPPELIAEDLRGATAWLGRVTGRIDVEEVLGEIFSRLCVGK